MQHPIRWRCTVIPFPIWVQYLQLTYMSVWSVIILIIVGLMRALWVQDHTIRKWILPRPCEIFRTKCDAVQDQIQQISCMDDLLSGEWCACSKTFLFYFLHVCVLIDIYVRWQEVYSDVRKQKRVGVASSHISSIVALMQRFLLNQTAVTAVNCTGESSEYISVAMIVQTNKNNIINK